MAEVFCGSILVLVTVAVHALGTIAALSVLRSMYRPSMGHLGHGLLISGLVVGMFLVSVLDAALWAFAYVAVGALADFETALYFSMVTFTTLGYGDIGLGPEWRLLASFEGANGVIMFGWTTALVVTYVQRLAGTHTSS
ncbi:MAG: two pore domain potassium channel family protein [Myxococcales bacterium]|nr:two pore domain potassium channel family protein [Myxococcales bacterium]